MKKTDLIVVLISAGCLAACGKNIPVQPVSSNTYLSGCDQTDVSENESNNKQDAENAMSDLVYYGEPARSWNKGDCVIITLSAFDNFEHIDRVCIRNCRYDHEIDLPISQEIRYSIEENGSYYVYAISDDGAFMDLSDYIGIEHSYANGTGDTGIIGL